MLLREFDGKRPRLGQGVFVADDVSIIGDVEVGDDVSLWFGVVLRGDVHFIRIGARANIQDNCVLHVTGGAHPTIVGEEVTVGHAAIVHGCTVERGALIGMGSHVLDGAVVGERALVAAGAVVSEGFVVPPRTLVAGVPAKVKRPLTDAELERMEMSWQHYVELKDRYLRK